MSRPDLEIQDLWIERAADMTGLESIASRVFGREGAGAYLLITIVVSFHIPVLSGIGYLQTGTLSMAENPGELFLIPAWIAIVWILIKSKRTYVQTVNELPHAIDQDLESLSVQSSFDRVLTLVGVPPAPTGKDEAELETIAPTQIKYGILLAGLAVYGIQMAVDPGALIGPVADLTGPLVAGVRFFVVIPLVFYPIGAELLAVVFGALVLLPFKIRRARLIDFADPHGYAGLVSAGQLFKSVAVSYFVLLTLFATFQTVAVGARPTDLFSSGLILAGLAGGLVFFFAPILWMKSFLSAAKEAKIEALAEQSRAVGPNDDLFPYAEPTSGEDASQYTYNHIRMQRVRSTSEFPLNVSMLQEIVFALLLPYLSSVTFDFLLNSMG